MSTTTLAFAAAMLTAAPLVAMPGPATVPANARPAAEASISRAAFVARLDSGYRTLDANHDGALTATELAAAEARARAAGDQSIAARRGQAFARLDTNRDGYLSKAEYDAAAPPRPPMAQPAAMLAALDSDKNRTVSLTEYRARGLARFDRADVNRDGIVTPQEERPGAAR